MTLLKHLQGREHIAHNIHISCPLTPAAIERAKHPGALRAQVGWPAIKGKCIAGIVPDDQSRYIIPAIAGRPHVLCEVVNRHTVDSGNTQLLVIYGLKLCAFNANGSLAPMDFFQQGTAAIAVGHKPMWSSPLWNTSPEWLLLAHQTECYKLPTTETLAANAPTAAAAAAAAATPAKSHGPGLSYICATPLVAVERQFLDVRVGGVDFSDHKCPDTLDVLLLAQEVRMHG